MTDHIESKPRKSIVRLTADQRLEILEAIKAGEVYRSIAGRYGVTGACISLIAKKAGMARRVTIEQAEEVISDVA